VVLVALALVELPLVDARVGAAGQVDGPAHRLEQVRLVPVAQLGADDGEVGVGVELGGHVRDRVGVERAVVVQQQQVVGPLTRARIERHGHRGPEAEVAVGDQDPLGPEVIEQQRPRAVGAAVVDGDDAQARLGLVVERRQRPWQPPRPVVGDEHHEHGRRGRGCLHR
jgi:hypothetical protein